MKETAFSVHFLNQTILMLPEFQDPEIAMTQTGTATVRAGTAIATTVAETDTGIAMTTGTAETMIEVEHRYISWLPTVTSRLCITKHETK